MKSRKLFNRIAALRVERGVTRRELAEKIGVNFQTVGYLERQKYNPILDRTCPSGSASLRIYG